MFGVLYLYLWYLVNRIFEGGQIKYSNAVKMVKMNQICFTDVYVIDTYFGSEVTLFNEELTTFCMEI